MTRDCLGIKILYHVVNISMTIESKLDSFDLILIFCELTDLNLTITDILTTRIHYMPTCRKTIFIA
jgi:hypothetical protein